jgi:hypothetical protein
MKNLVIAVALFGTVIAGSQELMPQWYTKAATGTIRTGILTSTDIGMAEKGIGGLKTGDTSLWLWSSAGSVVQLPPIAREFLLVHREEPPLPYQRTVNRRQPFKSSAIAANCSSAASSSSAISTASTSGSGKFALSSSDPSTPEEF